MKYMSLPEPFLPLPITLTLPCDEQLIAAVQAELRAKAATDPNHCRGYFPALGDKEGIDADLPASERFARKVSALDVAGKHLTFNFLRLSLVKQTGDAPFHLDSDASTALTGDMATISKRLVWRLLLNLSDEHSRTLSYLDVDVSTVRLRKDNGYIHCEQVVADKATMSSIRIPHRTGNEVSGMLFCASRVLHTGQDDDSGHFVAGFGCEEADSGHII